MKALLVAEYRDGKVLNSTYELVAFAEKLGAESVMFLVGSDNILPAFAGTLYLADVSRHQDYNPAAHKQLLLDVIAREQPEIIVFSHSSYGWDLAPRVAIALQAAQISEVVEIVARSFVVPACNSKLRRELRSKTTPTVVTLQSGAFPSANDSGAAPDLVKIDTVTSSQVEFCGYEALAKGGVDLTKSEIIVSAGRGIGKAENLAMISALAEALGGDYGASRPVVDAEWAEHNRQIGTTGQTVAPKLYVACGISGAIQHLAGIKKSEFIVAINTDKDAPIGEVADVLAVADLKQLVPVLTEKIKNR